MMENIVNMQTSKSKQHKWRSTLGTHFPTATGEYISNMNASMYQCSEKFGVSRVESIAKSIIGKRIPIVDLNGILRSRYRMHLYHTKEVRASFLLDCTYWCYSYKMFYPLFIKMFLNTSQHPYVF